MLKAMHVLTASDDYFFSMFGTVKCMAKYKYAIKRKRLNISLWHAWKQKINRTLMTKLQVKGSALKRQQLADQHVISMHVHTFILLFEECLFPRACTMDIIHKNSQ